MNLTTQKSKLMSGLCYKIYVKDGLYKLTPICNHNEHDFDSRCFLTDTNNREIVFKSFSEGMDFMITHMPYVSLIE